MKISAILLLLLSTCLYTTAQIIFEPGYFIDNEGNKTECLIKNSEWAYNPEDFFYKLPGSNEIKRRSITDALEFSITNASKYKRFTVNIDTSGDDLDYLSSRQEPEFSKQQVYLKVLVEGKATLFFFENGVISRYFFSTDSISAAQLIYKKYNVEQTTTSENETYRQQLWQHLSCPEISIDRVRDIGYNTRDLRRLFILYNNCQHSKPVIFGVKKRKDAFNLVIRPGLNSSHLQILNRIYNIGVTDFGSNLSLRVGMEAEFVMPFHKNKWSVLLEPTFQYYKSATTKNNKPIRANYKSIEIPLGIRYYLFLNDKSRIFTNASFIYDVDLGSEIYTDLGSDPRFSPRTSLAFGLGYAIHKFRLEGRYMFNRQMLSKYNDWSYRYSTFSFIFGYEIF